MRSEQLLKYQQGGKNKWHLDNPYLDAAVELTPLGDVRDIYEGMQSGDYQQSIGGYNRIRRNSNWDFCLT